MEITNTSENLKRAIGPGSVALASLNVMVGSGIFVLPAIIADGLGATAMLAYFVCGLMVFLIALCFAELGSKTIKSGGAYTYIEEAFGPYAGFLSANLYVFGALASDAALANALADTLQYFFPVLRLDVYRILFQFIIFGGLCWLNISSVKNGIRFVVFAGFAKIIPLIILVCMAIPYVEPENLKWVVQPTVSNIGAASLLLFFAFLGFETPLINGGEIKNAKRSVPLGLFGGLLLVLVLYLSIQTVTQGLLGDSMQAHKDTPLVAVANIAIGKSGMMMIVAVMAISILGSLSGEVLSIPRIMFAAARNKMLPGALAKVHPKFDTPHIAIIVYASIGFILAVSGGFKQLAIIASISLLLIYLGVVLASIKLKRNQTNDTEKAFRVPGGVIIPFISAASIVWLLSHSSKAEVIGIGIFVAVFTAIYVGMRWRGLDNG